MYGFFGVIVTVAAVLMVNNVFAANPFQMGKVDYFQSSSITTKFQEEQEQVIDWRESLTGADGKVNYYTPPSPVLALLENPNEKTAKDYLKWQTLKQQQIQKAQEMVRRVEEKGLS